MPWAEVAPALNGQQWIWDLLVFQGDLYAGTYPGGRLFKWNGLDAWTEIADAAGASDVRSLVEYDGTIFCGSAQNASLYRWDPPSTLTLVAPSYLGERFCVKLFTFNDEIYGLTYNYLLKWNGVDAWTEVAAYTDPGDMFIGQSFQNEIFAGTNTGKLFKWDKASSMVEIADTGAVQAIIDLQPFQGNLYFGQQTTGKLYKWDGNTLTTVAEQLGGEGIFSLAPAFSTLYAGTDQTGKLYKWNGVDAWEEINPQLNSQTIISSLLEYPQANAIFAGTAAGGRLFNSPGTPVFDNAFNLYYVQKICNIASEFVSESASESMSESASYSESSSFSGFITL